MKDTIAPITDESAVEQESFANRKLIRPSLSRNEHNHNHNYSAPAMGDRRPDRSDRGDRADRNGGGRKPAPPESTNAENFYYQKQMQAKTSMVVVLQDGEEIRGVIEWYDRNCLKLLRDGEPNIVVYKPSIKYLYKEGENAKK